MCWENIHNVLQRKRDSVVDGRCYELTDYEKDSIKQIEDALKTGYDDPQIIKEHLEYLAHMVQRLSGIVECERSVGAPTASLEKDIQKIKDIYMSIERLKKS